MVYDNNFLSGDTEPKLAKYLPSYSKHVFRENSSVQIAALHSRGFLDGYHILVELKEKIIASYNFIKKSVLEEHATHFFQKFCNYYSYFRW